MCVSTYVCHIDNSGAAKLQTRVNPHSLVEGRELATTVDDDVSLGAHETGSRPLRDRRRLPDRHLERAREAAAGPALAPALSLSSLKTEDYGGRAETKREVQNTLVQVHSQGLQQG